MAIQNDVTRRAMKTFVVIALIAGVAKSDALTCSHDFNATHAIISCRTNKMYPKGNCIWTYNGEPLNGLPPTKSEFRRGANIHYSKACSTSLKIESPGKHKVLLEFLQNQGINMSQEIDIVVVTPNLTIAREDNNEAIESSVMIQENTKIDLICTAMGGVPQVRSLTFECQTEKENLNTMSVYSQTARIFITATANEDAKQCYCTAKQLSLYEDITKSVTIYRAKTPDQPKLSVSNGRITNGFLEITDNEYVVLTCRSAGGKPTNTYMTLECLTDPPYTETVYNNDTVSLGVTIQKEMNGRKCSCSAKHITSSILTTDVTIDVLVPPTLSMYNAGTGVEMTSTIHVKDNQTLTLKCQSNGGMPAKSKMILSCPSDGTTRNQIEHDDTDIIQLSVHFNNDMDGRQCSCSVQHPSGYSRINLNILIVVPPRLSMYNAGTGVQITSGIIVKEKQTITLECKSSGGRPAKSEMILSCPRDGTTSNQIEHDDTDIIRLSVGFNNDMDGRQCSCSVQHPSGHSSIELMIWIVVTPSNPVIHADKGLVIDSKLIVKENEHVYVTCKSLGGKPKQSRMKIACPYQEISQYTDTLWTYISFTRNMNGQRCNCSAKHISSHESLITLLTITVVVVPQTPLCHTDFDNNSAIIACTTSKVFPGANCQFNSFDGFETLMLPMTEASRHSIRYYPVRDTVGYYNTTCRTSLAITRRSNFTITSSMFPELQLINELEKYHNFVKVHKTFKFEVDSAKIQTFTINKLNPNDVKHVNAKSETTLTCTAFGNPLPTIVISYINSKRESTTLSRGNGYELSHKFNPTCSNTGLYRCNVSNMLNAQEETYAFNLKVACPAEYYQTTDTLPRFGVPVNEDFNITLSVRVYPEPKIVSLFQGSSPIRPPKKILFTYTNEYFSLGEISIAMYLQNETGLGVYSLRVWRPQESTLNFNLTAEGRPLCPTDFIIQNVSANAMTISWRPGFDGGLRQTFSVFSHDAANNITDSSQVEHTSNDVMVYNVTDLSEGTLYILSVVTENSKGKTKCPHLNINGTTLEGLAPTSVTPAFITTITSSVAGILIVLILGIISVILMRTRRCHQPVSLDVYQAFSSRITFKHQREHTVQNQLYNGVSGSIAEEDSTLNSGGVSTFKSLSTNAPGNPHFKIESAAIGEIYANVVKFESDAAQNANNSAGVYNNTKSLKASGNDVKKSNIIAAMKHSKPRGQDGVDESGRTVSADGLTYVSVVVKPKDRKMKFGEGEEDTVRGPIDYAAIDLAATSKANREKMAKK